MSMFIFPVKWNWSPFGILLHLPVVLECCNREKVSMKLQLNGLYLVLKRKFSFIVSIYRLLKLIYLNTSRNQGGRDGGTCSTRGGDYIHPCSQDI
jgi:hypothetical protein